ncbi:class II fructose-bisphosphate aldolase [Patescibacteria group bacterium]|nr:class II fructose-bisphosphate aldolase [Patescibacteria group bacterium]
MRTFKAELEKAEAKGIALGHFNIAAIEQLNAISDVARKLNVPVVVGVSEGERKYIGVPEVRALLDALNKQYGDASGDGFWLFLNADHTHDPALAEEAARNGFDEVLFDGGKFPLDEDIAKTKAAVQSLKAINPNVLVEGEIGYIGSDSEMWDKIPEGAAISPETLTKPEDAARFVKDTGVDMLAPAVGNIHGMFKNAPNPRLDIPRIKAIKEAVKIPLVLHGGSGIVDEDFTAAIAAGITLVHISTEIRAAWRKGVEEELKAAPDELAPYKIMPEAIRDMEEVIEKRLRLFMKL